MLRRSAGRHDCNLHKCGHGTPDIRPRYGNQPERDVLLEQWQIALLDDDGVDLDGMGVTCSMACWADFLYDKPASPGATHEASEMELEQSVDAEHADLTWLLEAPPEERDFVERLGREVGLAEVIPAPEEAPDPIVPGSALEAVPLPSWLKRRLIRVLLPDVHHAGGFDGPRLRNQGGSYVANEAISLPAIETHLRKRPPAPDWPTTDGGPG
jgi:hypothetical protein